MESSTHARAKPFHIAGSPKAASMSLAFIPKEFIEVLDSHWKHCHGGEEVTRRGQGKEKGS